MTRSLSIIILTYKRDDALKDTLTQLSNCLGTSGFQIVLVDNNVDGKDRSEFLSEFEDSFYIREGYNAGVTAGRNRAIARATGDVLLFLDDDALLDVPPGFKSELLEAFSSDPSLGVVAFRSFVGEARIEDDKEFPHTDKKRDHSKRFDTFRFIGVAHALRATAVDEAGFYCESFFYGMEEFDLAYRFIKLGYRIEYRPDFIVQHMKSTDGRLPSNAVARRMYANKLSVGWMHLPVGVFLKSATAWFLKTLIDSRNPMTPFLAIGDFLAMVSHGQLCRRSPSEKLVSEIKRLGGAPWR